MRNLTLAVLAVCAAGSAFVGSRARAQCEFYPAIPGIDCEPSGGLEDSPDSISPPIALGPVYECSATIRVSGFARGATINIYKRPMGGSTPSLWASGTGSTPWGQAFSGTPLIVGDVVYATQQMPGGPESAPSDEITALDLPDPLPAPDIEPVPVYECGQALAVNHLITGSHVAVEHQELGTRMDGTALGEWTAVVTSPNPFEAELDPPLNSMTAVYDICGKVSAASEAESIYPVLFTLTPPSLPPWAVAGQAAIRVYGTVFGSQIDLISDLGGLAGSGVNYWGDDSRIEPILLGRPLEEGETLTATQALCDPSVPSEPVTVVSCSELPPPIIRTPQPGDDHIDVLEAIPDARIIVFAVDAMGVSEELVDGGGPRIRLMRSVRAGETIKVIQMLGECVGEFAQVIGVPCKRTETIPLVSASSAAFEAGSEEFDLGSYAGGAVRIRGQVYYPVDPAFPGEVAPYGGRLPVVFFMHGNGFSHSCEFAADLCPEPNLVQCLDNGFCERTMVAGCPGFDAGMYPAREHYLGAGTAAAAVARAGMILVSIDANDICSGGTGNVAERRDLFQQQLNAWFHGTGLPSHLEGRLDPTRVVVAGHSRAAEAAILLASSVGVADVTVHGAIAIAPTALVDSTAGTAHLLVVTGTRDGDAGPSGQRLYDLSTSAAWRSLISIRGANHGYWISTFGDEAGVGNGAAPLTRADQETLLAELLLGGAQEMLQLPTRFGDFLRGDVDLDSTVYQTAHQFTRPSDLIWNHYQSATSNALGGVTTTTGFIDVQSAVCQLGSGPQPEAFIGASHASWLQWEGTVPTLEEELPGGVDDATYGWLSVRMAQVPPADSTSSSGAIPVSLAAMDGSMTPWSVAVEPVHSQVGSIYAFDMPDGLGFFGQGWDLETFGRWDTIRVPLQCVLDSGIPNGDSLRGLAISFDAEEGWVTVDDLVFQQ